MRIQWGKHFDKDQWLLYEEWFSVEVILDGSLVAQLVKESACNAGDPSSISGSERSPGEGNGYPLQYSGLENSMDCIVHGITKSQT